MDHYQNKVAVLLYLYHTDLWNEIRDLLRPIKQYIHLYLGLCEEQNNLRIIKEAEKYFKTVSIQEFPNAGADVRPFLHQILTVDAEKEPFFIKIHSKKSMIGSKNHINWRSVLLHSLIGSKKIFLNNIQLLSDHHNIGVLCNKNLIMENSEWLNTNKIKFLCNLLGVNYNILSNKKFCGGNIFAGNTKLFQKYFSKETISSLDKLLLLETKKVTDDKLGSFCHSLERLFGYIAEYDNQNIIGINLEHINNIKILNDKAPNGQFNLIINYDGSCYISEDVNVYGKVLLKNKKDMLIEWHHLNNITHQLYASSGCDTYKQAQRTLHVL